MTKTSTPSPHYLWNPDVVLREEGSDGALIFQPDTNQIKVLNATGLFIWQRCDGNHTLSDLITALLVEFEGAPESEVAQQVEGFVESLVQGQFISVIA